jgi:tRNA dimethylallyltransferase
MDAVAILGPTASGKSLLGSFIARERNGEVISVDSRQAYIGLDIGTSKPTKRERETVPHHLVDILDVTQRNNAERYARLATAAVRDVISRGRLPILVGGSGLYFRAIFEGLFAVDLPEAERVLFERGVKGIPTAELHRRLSEVDAKSSARIHRNDRYRIVRALEVYELTGVPLSRHFELHARESRPQSAYLKIGLELRRQRLHQRIERRTAEMIADGWVEEVRRIIDDGYDPGSPGLRTLGYPEVISHIRGEMDGEELIEMIQRITRQYAKRQMTWFRKERNVHWFDAEDEDLRESVLRLIDETRRSGRPAGRN